MSPTITCKLFHDIAEVYERWPSMDSSFFAHCASAVQASESTGTDFNVTGSPIHTDFGVTMYQQPVSAAMPGWMRAILADVLRPELVDEGLVKFVDIEELPTHLFARGTQAFQTSTTTTTPSAVATDEQNSDPQTAAHWKSAQPFTTLARDTQVGHGVGATIGELPRRDVRW